MRVIQDAAYPVEIHTFNRLLHQTRTSVLRKARVIVEIIRKNLLILHIIAVNIQDTRHGECSTIAAQQRPSFSRSDECSRDSRGNTTRTHTSHQHSGYSRSSGCIRNSETNSTSPENTQSQPSSEGGKRSFDFAFLF